MRQARDMAASGALGTIRVVQVEYPQDWLTTRLEETGHKQAAWRTDPARSGNAGCIGDIGTHAFHLAEFVTGLRCESVAAELTRFVKGRALDDNAQMLLRFSGGARGMLWSSQVAPGNENALRLRVYGEKAGLDWSQEQPNALLFTPLGGPPQLIRRAGSGASAIAAHASRIPAGTRKGIWRHSRRSTATWRNRYTRGSKPVSQTRRACWYRASRTACAGCVYRRSRCVESGECCLDGDRNVRRTRTSPFYSGTPILCGCSDIPLISRRRLPDGASSAAWLSFRGIAMIERHSAAYLPQ